MQLIGYFARRYPRESLLTIACLAASAAAEGVGIATFVPLLAIAMNEQAAEASPGGAEIAAAVEGFLGWLGLPFSVLSIALLAVLLMWLKAGLLLLSMRYVGNTVAMIESELRLDVLRDLFAARWSYFGRHQLGRLTNAMATEATRASQAYRQLALATKYATVSLVGLALAMFLSWQLALVTLVGWFCVALALNGLVRMARRAGRKQTVVINQLLARLTDALLNVKLLKTMRLEDRIGPLLARDTGRLQKAMRKQVLAKEALVALQEPIMFMMLLAAMWYSQRFALLGREEVVVMLFALLRTLSGVTKLQSRYQHAVSDASALDSLLELKAGAQADAEVLSEGAAPTLERGIELRSVDFAYDERPVLQQVDLEIPAGEITALLGSSGGGKTTITDLVTGLIRPDAGEVTVDGVPLDAIDLAAWRSSVGYVPQDVVLMHDSVRVNVTFGDESCSDARVEEALRAAGVWEVVCEMPGGLDASVGERGSLLSGGQRARIGLARALVGRPALLILDEATAALDPETEAVVLETIQQLRGRVTVLAISHQPALREIADRVYRVDEGRARRLAPSQSIAS